MAFRRIQIDLAIPETIPQKLLEKPTAEQLTALGNMTWMEIIKEVIKRLKFYSQKINAGTDREEDTAKAKWHICRHDEGRPCDPEKDLFEENKEPPLPLGIEK